MVNQTDKRAGLLGALLMLAIGSIAAGSAAAASAAAGSAAAGVGVGVEPAELVQQTTDQMLALIEEAQSYAKEDPERFYTAVEALLSPVVDFPRFARSVMAAHYKKASAEQRERFAESFKWNLVRTYAFALTEFSDGEVVLIVPDKPPRKPNRRSIKQEIRLAGGNTYTVIYSMGRANDQEAWRMRNIIVEGVNMGITYRSQFKSAMQDPKLGGDIDKVIDAWSDVIDTESADEEDAAVKSS